MASNANEKDTARPRFFKEAVQNMAASEKEGRPVFEEQTRVEIFIPGDKLFRHVDVVQDKHKQRWPEHWAAFERGEARAASGTPLEQWPNALLNKARVAELKAMHILSVEDLAGVPDNVLPKMGMGARELREQARSYLDTAKAGAQNAAMAARIAQLEEMVQRMAGSPQPTAQSTETTAPQEKSLEECSDDELKEFIKRETGEAPRGRISRETLLQRAAELATAKAEAA